MVLMVLNKTEEADELPKSATEAEEVPWLKVCLQANP